MEGSLEEKVNWITKKLMELEHRVSNLERSFEDARSHAPPAESRYLSRIISEAKREFERRPR